MSLPCPDQGGCLQVVFWLLTLVLLLTMSLPCPDQGGCLQVVFWLLTFLVLQCPDILIPSPSIIQLQTLRTKREPMHLPTFDAKSPRQNAKQMTE